MFRVRNITYKIQFSYSQNGQITFILALPGPDFEIKISHTRGLDTVYLLYVVYKLLKLLNVIAKYMRGSQIT